MILWLRRIPAAVRILALLLGIALLLALAGYLKRDAIRYTLAHWTGETELRQQVRGTLSLLRLRLMQRPPQTAPLMPIRYAGVSPYGVNTFLEQEVEAEKVERSLRLIAKAGFYWVRQEFPWEDIEIAGKGDYWDPKWDKSTWDKYDRIVDLAHKYNLELIVRLDQPPAWARKMGSAPGWSMAPPDHLEDYGDFVAAVVSRYRGRVRYYQIWNEPNIFPQWGDQPADPAGYVRMLQIAYTRAKEADPDCVILCAGLAQNTEETPPQFGPRNMSDLLYLDKMYQAGAKGYFDIMGAMVYGLWTGPYDLRWGRDRANYSRAQLLREVMVRYGDGDKAIWATEMGWNAVPQDFPIYPVYGRVSEATQATYAIEAYRRAAEDWPWMGVLNYWFLRRPSDAEVNQVWYYFRMLEPDFRPLPVYDALAQWANQPPTVFMGYHQEDHWALRYGGAWQRLPDAGAVLGDYARGGAGATLDLSWHGTDLTLVLRQPQPLDGVQVSIDGRPVRLGKPQVGPAGVATNPVVTSIAVARGLPDARHQAHIEIRTGTLALDGLLVERKSRPWWPWVVGLGVCVPAFTMIIRRCRRGRHA